MRIDENLCWHVVKVQMSLEVEDIKSKKDVFSET